MAFNTGDTTVTEFTEENVEQTGLIKWSREKEGIGHSVTTDKEAKAYRKKLKSRNSDMSWKEFALKIPSYRSSKV